MNPTPMLDEPGRLANSLVRQGFAILPAFLDPRACEQLLTLLPGESDGQSGLRQLLQRPWCADLARAIGQHPHVIPALPADAVAVQCTLFSKSPDRNWLVSLHQDRSIPVRRRVAETQLTGWSDKEGDLFVQPPAAVLEQLTAVRIHLDPCPAERGALRVVAGSHAHGVLSTSKAEQLRRSQGEQPVPVPQGGALLMKPLILHASSKSLSPGPRRVLHFVFGPRQLPFGLEWPQQS